MNGKNTLKMITETGLSRLKHWYNTIESVHKHHWYYGKIITNPPTEPTLKSIHECGSLGCAIGFLPIAFPQEFYYATENHTVIAGEIEDTLFFEINDYIFLFITEPYFSISEFDFSDYNNAFIEALPEKYDESPDSSCSKEEFLEHFKIVINTLEKIKTDEIL